MADGCVNIYDKSKFENSSIQQFKNGFTWIFGGSENKHKNLHHIFDDDDDDCDSDRARTHNHLVCKQTLNHLAKWLNVHLRTKWLQVRVPLLSLKLQILHLFQARSSLTFRQLWSADSL